MYVSNVFTLFVFGLERVHFSCDFLFQMRFFLCGFFPTILFLIFLFVFVALGIYVLFWMRKSTIKLKYFYYVVQSQACFSNSSVFSRIVRLTKSNEYTYINNVSILSSKLAPNVTNGKCTLCDLWRCLKFYTLDAIFIGNINPLCTILQTGQWVTQYSQMKNKKQKTKIACARIKK